MISYKEYLNQINEAKVLTHLEHVEDSILTIGVQGAKAALDMMKSTMQQLSGIAGDNVALQLKIDGSPSIIAGVDPGNNRFFVGTKSLFNKTPKVNYSNEDIDKNHPSPGLNKKLKEALEYLPKAFPSKGIFQCDFIFSKEDIKKETVNGEKMITFTPNTITYALPTNTKIAENIQKKKIGIALHTEYKGNSILDMKAEALLSISNFKETKDVFVMGNTLEENHVLYTEKESEEILSKINELEKELKKFNQKDVAKLTDFKIEVQAFLNGLVKTGNTVSDNSIKEFMDYLTNKEVKNDLKYKSNKGKEKNKQRFEILRNDIRKMSGTLYYMLLWNKNVSFVKNRIIKKIGELSSMNTFIRRGNSFESTAPEGIVAIDRLSGSMVKLVDRLEFSKNNFLISNF